METVNRLLAISANPAIIKECQEILVGREITWVEDPQEALRSVEEEEIGLVLIDCEIGEKELWRRVKERNGRTSIVLMGGELSAEELVQAYRDGIYDYVSQSRLSTDLKRAVERIEERRELGLKEESLRKKLRESERKYRGLIEHANDAIFTLAANGVFTFVNGRMEEVTGRKREELVGERFSDFVVPEKREDFARSFQRIWSQGSSEEIEVEVLDKEGKRVILAINNTPILVDEELMGIQCIARDITQRKEAEERFKSIVETTEEGIVTFDGGGRFTSLNKAAEGVLGHRSDQLLGESLQRIVSPKEGEAAQSHLSHFSPGEGVRKASFLVFTSEGQEREVEFQTKPLEKLGKVIGAISVVNQVVTESREETSEGILDSLENPVLTLNERGEITSANQALLGRTGYSISELKGKPISHLIDQEEQEPDGKTRLSLKGKGGNSLIVLAHSYPLRGRLRGRIIIGEKVID